MLTLTMINDNDTASKFKATVCILFVFGRTTIFIICIWPNSQDPLLSTARFSDMTLCCEQQQQQQQPFNDLCSGTTRVGWYQKKHSAFCLSIELCCVQAGLVGRQEGHPACKKPWGLWGWGRR